MQNIYVKDIINLCQGKILFGSEDVICQDFSKDTRELKIGATYIGIKGEKFDGNTFYKEALDKGAKVCILEYCELTKEDQVKYHDRTIIIVDNTIETIQTLASYKRNMYDIPVIAITGSVGKTSTKDIIASVLNQKYHVLKSEKNYNNHIGLPLTILKLEDHDCLVLEMGMNHFKEISKLTTIARPTHAVITNIGTAHIGNLGSRDNILRAKLEILEGLSPDGKLIINNDNDLLHEYYARSPIQSRIITVGINNSSNYNATNIQENELSSNFIINGNKLNINIPGKPFIYNSLISYAIGIELGLTPSQIAQGLNNVKLSNNRLEKHLTKNNITIIDDTYNASYDSVVSTIELLSKANSHRRIIVLGDMLELGDYSVPLHNDLGTIIANSHIDTLITLGELSKHIISGAILHNFPESNTYSFTNHIELLSFLKEYLKPQDTILLKGSHSMNLANIVDSLLKYYNE